MSFLKSWFTIQALRPSVVCRACVLSSLSVLSSCGGGGGGDAIAGAESVLVPVDAIRRVSNTVGAVSEARAVLLDGQVLITGGDRGVGGVPTVQAFDPAAKTFREVGQLLQRRFVHSATVTTEGRLVVAGGFNYDVDGQFLNSVESFDPVQGTSQMLPPLCDARDNHHAVALAGGKVMYIGGDSNAFGYISRVEIYDPVAGSDTCTRQLDVGRVHEAVADVDGFVYVFGGLSVTPDFDVRYEASVEKVDKATGQIAPAGSILVARKQFEATALPDGRVLISGGYSDGHPTASVEMFDPQTGVSVVYGAMHAERAGHSATLLDDGRVLIAGGIGVDGVLNSTEIVDVEHGSIVPGPAMTTQRSLHVAAKLPDGSVLLSGGYTGYGSYTDIADVFTPAGKHL